MDLGFAGRVALVTGSSRGIGRATAESLSRHDARVAITYRHNRGVADAVARDIIANGGEAEVLFLDLESVASIGAAVDAVLRRWGRLDILVNNAVEWGARLPSAAPPFERLAVGEWSSLLRANIEGPYAAIQAALPSMRRQRWGRIVNISSVSAVDGLRGAAWYGTAKAAIHGLTRTLAKELGPDGILANVVMPGLTMTEHVAKNLPADVREQVAQALPIRRLLAPDEVAAVVVFLCSQANTAITGEIVRASGGQS